MIDEKVKVLVVDDMHENLIAMEAMLCDMDIDIVTAQSGNEALSKMLSNDFALVLLDVQMPGMDGFETARLMAGSTRTKNTPIIFLTALSKEDIYIHKGYESGAVDYLLKPINPEILKQKVTIFIRLYEQNMLIKSQAEKLEKVYQMEVQARRQQDILIIQQSKLATMGEMIGFLAHQWKQPLNILGLCLSNIDIITENTAEYANIKELVNSSYEQITYMSETIDDFRTYLRPDKETTAFNPNIEIENVLKLLGSFVTRRGIKLKHVCMKAEDTNAGYRVIGDNIVSVCPHNLFLCRECPVRNIVLHGPGNEFKQVLINLINNARDAIEAKEVNTDNNEIVVTTNLSDNNLVIRISDTAGGVPDSIKDKIFEPYFTTKKENGTGIGLSMVKSIINNTFHGDIDFCNQERGAEFRISIPIMQQHI